MDSVRSGPFGQIFRYMDNSARNLLTQCSCLCRYVQFLTWVQARQLCLWPDWCWQQLGKGPLH